VSTSRLALELFHFPLLHWVRCLQFESEAAAGTALPLKSPFSGYLRHGVGLYASDGREIITKGFISLFLFPFSESYPSWFDVQP